MFKYVTITEEDDIITVRELKKKKIHGRLLPSCNKKYVGGL